MDILNSPRIPLTKWLALALLVTLPAAVNVNGASEEQAKVTKIVRDVKLLPEGGDATPAAMDDTVAADTGVRTGDRSRSELTFTDLTIERLGANTVFHFNNGGRSVELDNGSMLLRVPKDSGGAQLQTRAVTVGVSGTTLIVETTSGGRNKLIVLEGTARLSLNRDPRQRVEVQGGQMEDVPPGATKLRAPATIDLNKVLQDHPLITDFDPLPSQDLIYAAMRDQSVQGRPAMTPPPVGSGNAYGGPSSIGGGSRGPGRQPAPTSKTPRQPSPTGQSVRQPPLRTAPIRTPPRRPTTPPPRKKPQPGQPSTG